MAPLQKENNVVPQREDTSSEPVAEQPMASEPVANVSVADTPDMSVPNNMPVEQPVADIPSEDMASLADPIDNTPNIRFKDPKKIILM